MADGKIDTDRHRYPYCIVWTPIPCLTWLFPFIGHMGICMSSGVIRDFAGPYYVSEDNMAFGNPTKYWQLDPSKAEGGASGWDNAVIQASDIYAKRVHNLFCDNCHSHVARALNLMQYDGSSNYNMVTLCFYMLIHGKYVSFPSCLKTWIPAIFMISLMVLLIVLTQIRI
eukprot:TRINITY_DN16061_c1_g1_i1.p1 TRINITY_DN16061_c1_g1~~TRINITY_DN16061_c1_g1_i1.p1  ORF type:complete len:170 (-),score=19.26 TRINITY_DN16061_c1_g1_i1:733-1242(-)